MGTVQLSTTTMEETWTLLKEALVSQSTQESLSSSTQNSRKSSSHTLRPWESTKSKMLLSGLVSERDKPRGTKKRELQLKRRESLKKRGKLAKLPRPRSANSKLAKKQ